MKYIPFEKPIVDLENQASTKINCTHTYNRPNRRNEITRRTDHITQRKDVQLS